MKLLRVGEKNAEKVAILDKNQIIRDISDHIKDLNPSTLNENTLEKLIKINLSNQKEIDPKTRIGSCISKPIDFLAIGLNYKAHAEGTKSKLPTEPILFNKSSGCIQGPDDPIIKPKEAKRLDYEVEVAIIIGKEGRYISVDKAQEYVFGYCIVNDISERSWQKERGGQWIKGKSIAGPIGPYLVTKDEITDINNLKMSLDLNGNRMQTGNTSTMIFNVNVIVSYVSKFMSLQAGDIITTGTPPGVGMGMKPQLFLKAGDSMRLSIENLGEQISKVVPV